MQAHVVAAFEQSLSNMTSRLQQLTATAERKDDELTDMRQTIELLRKQSIQAGLTTAHMQSMGVQTLAGAQAAAAAAVQAEPTPPLPARGAQLSKNRPTTASAQSSPKLPSSNTTLNSIQRQHSSESMCSLNSLSSGCSAQDKKKKKGWLRSSFTKAFSRNAKISKTNRQVSQQSLEHKIGELQLNKARLAEREANNVEFVGNNVAASAANSNKTSSPAKTVTLIENAKPIDAIETEDHQVVEDLKKQLREKDLVLTDIRLEALSSASQLESLKETVNKMRAEMMSLKQNNERLQKLVTTRSLANSEVSLGAGSAVGVNPGSPSGSLGAADNRRYSLAESNMRPPMDLPKRLQEEVEEENIPPAPG